MSIRVVFRSLAVVAVASLVASAGAAPDRLDAASPGQRVRYDGDSVVRVTVRSQAELDAVLDLAVTVWSERVGVGPVEVLVDPAGFKQLRAMGLDPYVVIDDIQVLIDAERAQIEAAARQPKAERAPGDGSFFQTYHDYDGINDYLDTLAAARPDLAHVETIGQSLQGRDMRAIVITGPDEPQNPASERPIIIWQGGQHAREWIAYSTVVFLADQLIANYGADQRITTLVDSVEFWIIPDMNPDGYVYTWNNQRLWRKNRRNNGNGTFGVDLNRNWGGSWWGGVGSSSSGSSETYHGTAAFSEPETQVLRDLADTLGGRVAALIDYHSYSQLVLWPWGWTSTPTPEPDRTFFTNVGVAMTDAMLSAGGVAYTPEQSSELYPAAGDVCDYFYGVRGVPAYTIELRDTGANGFVLPASEIVPVGQENLPAALLFAERMTRPISVSVDSFSTVAAGEATTVRASALNGAETVNTSSLVLYYSVDGGAYQSAPMTAVGSGAYEGALPATDCGSTIDYYVAAMSTNGSTVTAPLCGAGCAIEAEAVGISYAFLDDAESDTGWTVGAPSDTASTGIWERADPNATGAQPGDDASATGAMCWVTDGRGGSVGQYDIDGGATTLTSPVMDATADTRDAWITYARRYSNDQGSNPNTDSMPVEISNDNGATWAQLELVTENAGRWVRKAFRVADYVTPTSQVRVRFVARDEEPGSVVEAAVDDIALEFRGCEAAGPTADLNGDGNYNNTDINLFVQAFLAGDPAADLNSDGNYNNTDINLFVQLFLAGE